MARVKLEDGRVLNFEGTPTSEDIEEAVSQLAPQSQMSAPPSSPQQDPLYVPPPGTAKSQLKALLPKVEDVPEIAATVGAGMLTAARATPIAMGATGLAAAGAEGYKQVGQRMGMLPGKPPETSTQAIKQMGGAFARGAGAAVLGKTVDWARGFFGKQIPEAVYNSFLGTPQIQAASSIGKGAETLGSQVASLPLFKGMSGTRMSVLNKSKAGISFVEDKIQNELSKTLAKNPKASINSIDVASSLDDLIKEYSSTGVNQREVKQLLKIQNDFLTQHGETIPLLEANQLKRTFHKIINDRSFLKTMESNPIKVQAERTLASSLRNKIAEAVPVLNELNSRQGFLIGVRDNLIQAAGKETRTIPQAIMGEVIEPLATTGARGARLAGLAAERLPLQTGTIAAASRFGQEFKKKEKQ